MKIIFTKDKNALKLAIIITLILCITCIIGLIVYLNEISHFQKVSAKIIDVEVRLENSNKGKQTRNKYIRYYYNYDGKEYIGEKYTLLTSKRHIGDVVTIKINPKNPEEIQNNLYIIIYIIIIVLSAAVFLAISVHMCKKNII